MLEPLRSAIDATDWPRALAEALEVWRTLRAPELADLIDALGARCVVASIPANPRHQHAWWIDHAARYEPAGVTYLAAHAHALADESEVTKPAIRARWGDAHPLIAALLEGSPRWFEAVSPNSHLDAIDRLAAILAWPPDPRAAALLAGALETASLAAWGTMLDPVCGLLANALIALDDARILPRLARLAARDPGSDAELLARTRHAARACRALDAHRPPDPDLAALSARLAPDPASAVGDRAAAAIAELWNQVAAHPDELGPRLVLGDALVELGESRGELILLQCAGERLDTSPEDRASAKRRVRQLVEQQWERWLGPLAPFLHRKSCELRRGMLEAVRVGLPDSPDTGWKEAAGHHELCATHTVRPSQVSPAHYALFVEGLARPPRRLGLDGPEVIQLLRARLGALPIETAYYAHAGRARSGPAPSLSFAAAISALATLAPGLATLALDARCPPADALELLPQLPRMFPRLERVEIPRSFLQGPARAKALERSLPFVVVL